MRQSNLRYFSKEGVREMVSDEDRIMVKVRIMVQ